MPGRRRVRPADVALEVLQVRDRLGELRRMGRRAYEVSLGALISQTYEEALESAEIALAQAEARWLEARDPDAAGPSTVFIIVCEAQRGPPWLMLELPELPNERAAELTEIARLVTETLARAGYRPRQVIG